MKACNKTRSRRRSFLERSYTVSAGFGVFYKNLGGVKLKHLLEIHNTPVFRNLGLCGADTSAVYCTSTEGVICTLSHPTSLTASRSVAPHTNCPVRLHQFPKTCLPMNALAPSSFPIAVHGRGAQPQPTNEKS